MKTWKISVLFAVAAVFATTAFAANKVSVQVPDNVAVNGKPLSAGHYTVIWEGAGPNVDVSILRGKEVVAKTSGHLLTLSRAYPWNAAVTKVNPDGSKSLSEIQLGGKKYALDLGESTDAASAMK